MALATGGPAAAAPWVPALAIMVAGAGFGVVVVALDHADPIPLRAVAVLTGGGAGWAAFAIGMAAWWRRRLVLSVAAATFALAAAVTAYYVADAFVVNRALSREFEDLRFWTVVALVLGPPLGLVGWRARVDGTWVGLAAALVVPLGFAGESAIYLDGSEGFSPLERGVRLALLGAALVVGVVLTARTFLRNTTPAA